MMAYSTKIPGTPAYWFGNRQGVESSIEQLGSPTFFFTLSFADLHHPDLKKLLFNDEETFDNSNMFKKINQNPHIVDWFFYQKVMNYTKSFFQDVLNIK